MITFAAEMLLMNAAIVALVARKVGRDEGPGEVARRLAWYTAVFAAICPFMLGRFDAVPALFAFASALWWSSGRSILGGLAAGLGTLVKIVPGVVAIPGMIGEALRPRASRMAGTVAFGLSLVAGVAGWVAVGGPGMLDSIRYHSERGIELGSLYSGVLRMAAWAVDAPATIHHDHASTNLITPWSNAAASLAMPIQGLALLLVAGKAWRSGVSDMMRLSGAAVLAFAATGKVFSPQYLIWVLPFLAVQSGRVGPVARGLFLAAAVATAAIYPWGFRDFERLRIWAFVVLNVRNALLLCLLGWLICGPADRGEPSATADDADGHR